MLFCIQREKPLFDSPVRGSMVAVLPAEEIQAMDLNLTPGITIGGRAETILSDEIDENGYPFILSPNGTTTFGEIRENSGLTPAPIKLSEGFQDANGKGYGLVHIEANHGKQIRNAGFYSVNDFVSYVATNYDEDNIRIGKRRDDGTATYLIQITDAHDNTLFIEMSKDGSYWNVNSAGIFRKGYSIKKETVVKSEPQQPNNAVSRGSSLSENGNSGITFSEPNGKPTVSDTKYTNNYGIEQQANLPAEASALSRIPRGDDGELMYESADADTAWDAIVEEAGDEAMAKRVVDSMVADKEAALKKAEKQKPRAGTTPSEKIAAERERMTAIDNARSVLDHWKRIALVPLNRKADENARLRREAEEAAKARREAEAAERRQREEAARIEREMLGGVPDLVDDKAADARARGYRRVNGHVVERQAEVPRLLGKESRVKFSDRDIPVGNWAIIDASQLQPSHIDGRRNPLHFLDEAQPKERKEADSVAAARRMAGNIRAEEITGGATAYSGSPTVNTRGEVIQGNNRSAALREMWQSHPQEAARYKQYLAEHADGFGFSPEDIESMEQPVLVNMLDVSDSKAIELGQFVASDTETGGIERIRPKNTVQKLGGDMGIFASKLLQGGDEEASFSQLLDTNGQEALRWMNSKGIITDTQYRSAFAPNGSLTGEAKNDLRGIMLQGIFQDSITQLETMFEALPAKAQKAILATMWRDFDSPESDRILPEVQMSIQAYYALSHFEAFANAKNYKEARIAAETWRMQYAFDDATGESYLPSERFSNFALLLASAYKAQTQRLLQGAFNRIFDLVQGRQEETLFEKPDNTPLPLAEAIDETIKEFNLENNFRYDGQIRSDVLGGNSPRSREGRRGSGGNAPAGERSENGEQYPDSAGGTGGNGRRSENSRESGNVQTEIEATESREEKLTEEDALALIANMEENAEVAPEIELTIENWDALFGENGRVNTPIGEVKMGEHQFAKLMRQGRNGKLGMIKPTLENPDIIIEDNSETKEGNEAERGSSYVYVKTFAKPDGSRFYYFTSVTVSQDGMEVVVSNQEKTKKRISNLLQKNAISWINEKVQSASETQSEKSVSLDDSRTATQADNNTAPLGINSSELLDNKNTADSGISQTLGEKVSQAEAETDTNPTDGQKEAGNYKKGHVRVGAFDITIENPKGSVRSGVDANGKPWQTTMNNTYGYMRGTEGVDGDHIDVFLSDNLDNWDGQNVFVVDQYNEDGTFDEHKVMLGFNDEAEAQDAYFSNYEKGWGEKRKIVLASVAIGEFEKWIGSSRRKTKPFAEYKGVNKEASQPIGQADTSDTAASGKENGATPRQDSLFADTGDNAQAKQKDAAEKIEDYGELIAGARKDLLKDLAKSMENATLQSLVSLPFSKAFKRPDLKKAFEAGALREKDVRFAEAVIASMLSEKKPKEKKLLSIFGSKKSKVEQWAENAYAGIELLKALFSMPEARDVLIERATSAKTFDVEKAKERQRQLEEWNHGKTFDGTSYPINNIAVFEEAYNRLGYAPGSNADMPVAKILPDRVYGSYELFDKNGKKIYDVRPKTFEEAVDAVVYLAKVANADPSASHPGHLFAYIGKNPVYKTVGWRPVPVTAIARRNAPVFETREEADKFIREKNEKHPKKPLYSPVPTEVEEVEKYGKLEVVYFNPLTRERIATGLEYASMEEAESSFDKNRGKIDEAVNSKLAEEKAQKGGKKGVAQSLLAIWPYLSNGNLRYGIVLHEPSAEKSQYYYPLYFAEGFPTREEAEDFLEKNRSQLESQAKKSKEERQKFVYFDGDNQSRIGSDYRGGKDVTAEEFANTFGFRGVQFGNWTNQNDRQAALNNAFDAFMDLSSVLGVSPRALSLDGELGIAFGSRGTGSAAAHYEPHEVVINLTKTQGAGTLAHEWWHALDNYFARKGNIPSGFATADKKVPMREELRDAFNEIIDNVGKSDYDKRSRQKGASYWGSIEEETARLFAEWVAAELGSRGEFNHFLSAGIGDAEERYARMNYSHYKWSKINRDEEYMSFDEFRKTPQALVKFPYPTRQELNELGKDVRRLFDTVQEKIDEESGNSMLFQKTGEIVVPTAEEAALRDAIVERLRQSGLEVITDADAGQRMIDLASGQGMMFAAARRRSPEAQRREELMRAQDSAISFLTGIPESEVRSKRREQERQFRQETKELYDRVLSGNFNSITLQMIDDFINKVTPNNEYGRPLSKRLPSRVGQKMHGGAQANSIDALFSRISESAVPPSQRAVAEGRRRIEAKKKELLKGWAIATGNWHTDVSDFTDDSKPIDSGSDSDVYTGKDGISVIKVSKGKENLKKFAPDIDAVALFNYVFPNSSYEILGYGEINGKFVRFLRQPIVDFSDKVPLSEEERVSYMSNMGFKPINKGKTVFSNGQIVVADLQKGNIVKDKAGNISVIDADVKLHTKDFGGNYTYPPVERDTEITPSIREHRVFHGSGADFDRFDHSHMGEGEGAQAYGWGTYVTEVEGIGRTYAEARRESDEDLEAKIEELMADYDADPNNYIDVDWNTRDYFGITEPIYLYDSYDTGDADEIELARQAAAFYEREIDLNDEYEVESILHELFLDMNEHFEREEKRLRDEHEQYLRSQYAPKATLYTVEIPDDNGSNYLEYGNPLPETLDKEAMAEAVFRRILETDEDGSYNDDTAREMLRRDLSDSFGEAEDGETLYGTIAAYLGDRGASEFLHGLGFVGISYPAEYRSGGRKDKAKNYVIFNEDDLQIVDKARFFRTPRGKAYGFTIGGRIYIDPRIASAETPIHEYSHLWASALRHGNAGEWRNIVGLMKGTPAWEETKSRYPELATDDEIADEVLATYSGRRGAERLREQQRKIAGGRGAVTGKAEAIAALEQVKEALRRFWKAVADFLHIRFSTAEEVADRVVSDLLEGVNPARTIEEQSIIDRAKADGTYMKAPNGAPTNLTERQWAQVRTRAFKQWFGDWEKAARIEKLRKSEPVVVSGNDYQGKYELNSKSAENYIVNSLRGEYANKDTGDIINVTRASRKVAHHDAENDIHLKSIAYIPQMIENAIFIDEVPNEKGTKFDSYRYYVVGLTIDGADYTAKLVVGRKNGGSYYDHALTEIEKNSLLNLTDGVKADVSDKETVVSGIKDKRLVSILQTNSSKVVDENGEPRVVYHGTTKGGFSEFNSPSKSKVAQKTEAPENSFWFVSERDKARSYSGKDADVRFESDRDWQNAIYPVFLNMKNPLVETFEGEYWDYRPQGGTTNDVAAEAREKGHDGAIIQDVVDEGEFSTWENGSRNDTMPMYAEGATDYVVFSPNQIKSATENTGAFSADNEDIRFSLRNPDDLLYREQSDELAEVKDHIEDIFNDAVSGRLTGKPVPIGKLTSEGKAYLENISGLKMKDDIDFVLNPSDLVHIYKKHFGKNEKDKRRNIPLSIDDIRNLSDVVSSPDRIIFFKEGDGSNRNMFYFFKGSEDGTYNLMEIYSDKKGNLTAKTFYKTRKDAAQRVMEINNSLLPTSGTYFGAILSDAKIPKIFDLPNIQRDSFRKGNGALDDDGLSMANDPRARLSGKPTRTARQRREFAERERRRMAERVSALAEKLHLGNVEIVTDLSGLQGKRKEAKGFFSRSTGRITIVVPNHASAFDAEQTLLHEAVGHYGLRRLFGDHFDTFLDNVYQNADEDVRRRIAGLSAKHGWDFRTATEEYLASLAEDTDFENVNASWWQKIKSFFLDMLRKIGFEGFTGVTLSDNELRYLLWRSYENLAEPGRYRGILEEAADIATQMRLKVGNYAQREDAAQRVAENSDLLYRNGEDVALGLADRYQKRVTSKAGEAAEAYQDNMRSVRILQEEIAKETGRPIADFENAYDRENHENSINKIEQEQYIRDVMKPTEKVLAKIQLRKWKNKEFITFDEIEKYLIAKHGLERKVSIGSPLRYPMFSRK